MFAEQLLDFSGFLYGREMVEELVGTSSNMQDKNDQVQYGSICLLYTTENSDDECNKRLSFFSTSLGQRVYYIADTSGKFLTLVVLQAVTPAKTWKKYVGMYIAQTLPQFRKRPVKNLIASYRDTR